MLTPPKRLPVRLFSLSLSLSRELSVCSPCKCFGLTGFWVFARFIHQSIGRCAFGLVIEDFLWILLLVPFSLFLVYQTLDEVVDFIIIFWNFDN